MSEEGKSFYEVALDNVPELTVADDGEYKLQVVDASLDSNDNGHYLLLRLEIPSMPDTKDITQFISLPNDEDTEKQRIRKLNRLRDATTALGYDTAAYGGIDPEAMIGLQGWADLTTEENAQYGEQNRIRSWVKGQ